LKYLMQTALNFTASEFSDDDSGNPDLVEDVSASEKILYEKNE